MMMMTSSMDAYSGADPAVATLSMDDQKIDFVTRIDTSTHPNVLKSSGAAMPLRLATLLPDSTELFMTMRFNPELKTAIQTQWMTALPPDVVPPNVAPMMQQAMTMIGDELTIALTGMEGLIPKAVIMMGMADPVNTKALLQMLIPMQPGEQHNGVDIMSMAVPLPVSLSIAFPGDIMMVSTDVTAMKGIIDLIQAGQKSTLFGAMQPAMDDALPRYSALVLKTGMIGQVVQQVAPLAGGLPPEASMVLDAFTSIVRELRMTQEMNGTWMDSKFSIYLNDAAAAPAPAAAAPAAAPAVEAAPAAAPAVEAAPAAAPAEAPAAK
jgi:hypothetical protein